MVKDQVDDDSLKVLFKQTHGLTYTVVSGWFMEDVLMQ